MSQSTKYDVQTINAEGEVQSSLLEKPASKKDVAIEAARSHRQKTGEGVRVSTQAGTVVFEMKPRKAIKMSPRFTRVVDLPEGAMLPEGQRVAYTRTRKHLAITHDPESKTYAVVNYVSGEILEDGIETTRESGAFCKTVPLPAKAEPEPANA